MPYTALPIASIISANYEIPMLIRRKETKDYGTKKLIEGQFKEGDKCIIIEDVITSGSSVLETAKDLRAQGLVVTDAVVLLNRQQGGEQILSEGNIKIKSLFTMTELIRILVKAGKIEPAVEKMVEEYLKSSQFHSLGMHIINFGTFDSHVYIIAFTIITIFLLSKYCMILAYVLIILNLIEIYILITFQT